ncbi:MAG: gliding motility-associated C-terminal domain-containing protein, partial [Bacteroidota bacterium]
TVADELRDTLMEQICFGQIFEFDGQQLTDAGTYQADLQSESGCDSIVVLELTVADEVRDTLTEQICFGQTFEFDGQQLTDAGTYQADLQSESGCDSIVVLELTVADEVRDTLTEQICFGQTFEFNGQQLTDAGTYQADLPSERGCDSIVVLELTVADQITQNLSESICSGSEFDFNGQLLAAAGTYSDTLQTNSGCDSIIILELTIDDQITQNLSESICSGSEFDFNGQLLTAAGTYSDTLQTSSGCDSIVILELTIDNQITQNLTESICSGSEFDFNGQLLTSAGIYSDTLQTSSGCDSIVTLELSVEDQITQNLTESICSGSEFDFNGQLLTVAGTYSDTLQTSSGCDSIVILELSVEDQITENVSESICSGSEFDFNGQLLAAAGTYSDTLQTSSGCDSIVILELTVDNQITQNLSESICSGSEFDFNGQLLTVAGTYRDTFQTNSGCDSIVILELKIDDLQAFIQANGTNLGCDLSEITLSATANSSIQTIRWSDGESELGNDTDLSIATAGTYFLEVSSSRGCLDTTQITISADSTAIQDVELIIQQPNCEGADIGAIRIGEVNGGVEPYVFALDDQAFSTNPSFTGLNIGSYTLRIQDAQGCEWDSTITINPPTDLTVTLGEDLIVSPGTSVTLNAFANRDPLLIRWVTSGKDSLSCPDCLSPNIRVTENAIYQIQVEDEDGCVAQDQIEIFVEVTDAIYVPNIFSPNGDNVNDYFYPQIVDPRVESIDFLQIYNRWGDKVFEQTNVEINNPLSGWDGRTFNNQSVNTNVFVYLIKLNYVDGTSELLEGSVMRLVD